MKYARVLIHLDEIKRWKLCLDYILSIASLQLINVTHIVNGSLMMAAQPIRSGGTDSEKCVHLFLTANYHLFRIIHHFTKNAAN